MRVAPAITSAKHKASAKMLSAMTGENVHHQRAITKQRSAAMASTTIVMV
jgi:hypothetical protein